MLISCIECGADFNLRHDMEEDRYKPQFCCFCGESVVNEDDDSCIDETGWDYEEELI